MKRVWWAIGLLMIVVIIGGVLFRLSTRPLISAKQAMAIAKEQLRYMGYSAVGFDALICLRVG